MHFHTLMDGISKFDYRMLRDIMDDEIYEYTCTGLENALNEGYRLKLL
jgi:hypothetical protein